MAGPECKPPVVFESTVSNWRQMATAGSVLILTGLLLTAWFEIRLAIDRSGHAELLAHGEPTPALVVAKNDDSGFELSLAPLSLHEELVVVEIPEQLFRSINAGTYVSAIVLMADPPRAAVQGALFPPVRKTFVPFLPFLAVGGLLYLRKGLSMRKQALRLDREGLTTMARLMNRWTETSGDDTAHFVSFAFSAQTPEGSRDMFLCTVSRRAYDAQPLGVKVRVRYLPDDPEQCRLEF